MAKSVLLYGPPASGKTRYAQQIAEKLGLTRVVELDSLDTYRNRSGVLYLTQDVGRSKEIAELLRADRLDIGAALDAIGAAKSEVTRG